MTSRRPRSAPRLLVGAWSRRGTLLPLLLLTTVVVGGSVAVTGFAEAAGTSPLLAVPLLLVGAVALPTSGRELAAARRREVALARLRGLEGGELLRVLVGEPLLVLVLGCLVGTAAGLAGAHLAAGAWVEAPRAATGPEALLAVLGVVVAVLVAALVAVLVGMAGALREPLAEQVTDQPRPRRGGVAAAAWQVLVLVGAAVALYRARFQGEGGSADGSGDLLVLAGPALVGLAAGHLALWSLHRAARLQARRTGSGLATWLASRRLARAAGSGAAVPVLVAAAVVGGLAVTGAAQVGGWVDETARLRAGGPVRVDLPEGDARGVQALTDRLDPDGRWLMGAVLVPGEGSVPARRAFVETDRVDRVLGDFYAGSSAEGVTGLAERLRGEDVAGPAAGTLLTIRVEGVSARASGSLEAEVQVRLAAGPGQQAVADVGLDVPLDGSAAVAQVPVPCEDGCEVDSVTLDRSGDRPLPYVLTGLQLGGTDLLDRPWAPAEQGTDDRPGGPVEVAGGLLAVPARGPLTALPARGAGPVPVLATRTADWDGDPVLESPGGEDLPAEVVARYPALPLVEGDGVYTDLARAAVAAPPTVPAAEVMVLARADTPDDVLAALADAGGTTPRPLDRVAREVSDETGAAQARAYLLVAGCAVLVALLVLLVAVAREQAAWRRDVAALRVVGVDPATVRRSTVREVGATLVVAVLAALAGTAVAVPLLLARLELVTVPLHAVPLRTSLEPAPLVALGVAVAVLVGLAVGRGRAADPVETSPAILRETGR